MTLVGLPVRFGALRGLAKELAATAGDSRPIVVGGMLADVLQKELVRDGDPRAVRVGQPEGGAVYVHVLGGPALTDEDAAALKRAERARVPLVVVGGGEERIPYVLATDVVPLPAGAGFPIEQVAATIARKLGEQGTALAARLPVLQPAVAEHLIESFARKNAIIGAAVFLPGADLPILTLNQVRLVLRLAAAHGERAGQERLPEAVATLGSGYAFRAVARQLAGLIPFAGWAVKGGVAYAGTRAVGEAALKYYEGTAKRQPDGASRAAS
jgi:uncharacterized protein (DUF697 family)